MTEMPGQDPAASTGELEMIGIVTAQPWSAVPEPLTLVSCGDRAALYAPGSRVATARDAAQAALQRARLYEVSGLVGRLLPVAPGALIAPDQAPAVLAMAEGEIARAEAEVRGAVEYQLRVAWAEDRVLAAFRDSPELAPVLASRRVRAGDLALGVTRLAQRLEATMDRELAAAGLDRVDQPRGPGLILHRALLVPAHAVAALDACLARIDALWTEGLTLRLIGPTPPVSFVLFDAVRVDAARRNAAWALLGPVGATGAAAIAAARKAALRTASDPGAAAAIRMAACDLTMAGRDPACGAWRLDRRAGAAVLPAAAQTAIVA